ncbi:nucleotide-diphospho-sugar transferase [Phlyctochytrium arcticum]|nr:nucleotide-diphospho-sugar transferase [Phlyctochytrium arcticum]
MVMFALARGSLMLHQIYMMLATALALTYKMFVTQRNPGTLRVIISILLVLGAAMLPISALKHPTLSVSLGGSMVLTVVFHFAYEHHRGTCFDGYDAMSPEAAALALLLSIVVERPLFGLVGASHLLSMCHIALLLGSVLLSLLQAATKSGLAGDTTPTLVRTFPKVRAIAKPLPVLVVVSASASGLLLPHDGAQHISALLLICVIIAMVGISLSPTADCFTISPLSTRRQYKFKSGSAAFPLCTLLLVVLLLVRKSDIVDHQYARVAHIPLPRLAAKQTVEPWEQPCNWMAANMPGDKPDAIVTFLSSDSYLHGSIILAHSLRRANTTTRMIVAYIPGSLSPTSLCRASAAGWELRELTPVPNSPQPGGSKSPKKLYKDQFAKLRLWTWEEFGQILLIDSDAIVIRSIEHLFCLRTEFAVATSGFDGFNAGVVYFRPSYKKFEVFTKEMVRTSEYEVAYAEQGFLIWYYMYRGRNFVRLPPWYNVDLNSMRFRPDFATAIWPHSLIMHYTARKPWSKRYGPMAVDPPMRLWYEMEAEWIEERAVQEIEMCERIE